MARGHALAVSWRRARPVLELALWAVLVLGGIVFFFYLIWNPER